MVTAITSASRPLFKAYGKLHRRDAKFYASTARYVVDMTQVRRTLVLPVQLPGENVASSGSTTSLVARRIPSRTLRTPGGGPRVDTDRGASGAWGRR